jgi:hypothetical protein
MKIELAASYRNWMLALVPATLGLGTVVLWLMSLGWPRGIDEKGLTLRDNRRVGWDSIRKIRVRRCYLDDHISHVRIHHDRGVAEMRLDRLQNGQDVARVILAMFEHVNRTRSAQYRRQDGAAGRELGDDRAAGASKATAHASRTTKGSPTEGDVWTRELAMLGKTLAGYPEKISDSKCFANEGI